MKDIMRNKKGFTLVELLAVIVVLAIIILIALPAVLSSMEKARKNSFVIETNEFVKAAQTAYSTAVMNGEGNIASGGTKYCVTFGALVNKGYIEKSGSDYAGTVVIKVSGDGKPEYTVNLKNKAYHITSNQANYPVDAKSVQAGTATAATCGSDDGTNIDSSI